VVDLSRHSPHGLKGKKGGDRTIRQIEAGGGRGWQGRRPKLVPTRFFLASGPTHNQVAKKYQCRQAPGPVPATPNRPTWASRRIGVSQGLRIQAPNVAIFSKGFEIAKRRSGCFAQNKVEFRNGRAVLAEIRASISRLVFSPTHSPILGKRPATWLKQREPGRRELATDSGILGPRAGKVLPGRNIQKTARLLATSPCIIFSALGKLEAQDQATPPPAPAGVAGLAGHLRLAETAHCANVYAPLFWPLRARVQESG